MRRQPPSHRVRSLVMEARDSRSKIRPLPIDEIDGNVSPHHRVKPPRRWRPLAVIVLGAIAFGIVARGLSPAGSPEVAGPTTTTPPPAVAAEPTTTPDSSALPPESLAQMLPFAKNRLDLVAVDESARIGNWALDSASPSYDVTVVQAVDAAFNASGSHVAVHTRVNEGSIVIDAVEAGPRIVISEGIAQWGGVWHPTDPDLFAWTAAPDAADPDFTFLRVADISGYAGETLEPLREIELPGLQGLLAWGDWGFVTEDWTPEKGPVVTLWDADGLTPLELEGEFFGATPAGLLLMGAVADSGYVPYLVELDRSIIPLMNLDIGASDFQITSDGEWVIALTLQADGDTSIFARTIRSRAIFITSIDEAGRFVAFALDGRYIALQESESGDLVFKDWISGAEYLIPIDGGESIADVHL